jgi:hypothetical protein
LERVVTTREQPSAQGDRFAVALVVDDHGREKDSADLSRPPPSSAPTVRRALVGEFQ